MIEPHELLQRLEPEWTAAHMEQRLAALHRSQRRRTVARVTFAVAVVLLVPLTFTLWPESSEPVLVAPTATMEPDERTIALADGSVVALETLDTQMVVESMEADSVVVRLDSGVGEFDVTRNADRVFQVRAGDVTVEVLGTRFRVERSDTGVRVHVHDGLVAVRWAEEERRLGAGESETYPPLEATTITAQSDEGAEPAATPREQVTSPREPAATDSTSDWREWVRNGDHDRAYGALEDVEVQGIADLLLAADAARYSGHPLDALPYLRRAHREFPDDPRAAMAAFTEGRVLLAATRFRDAARAFRASQELEPDGPLAEDSLAREVEALARSRSPNARGRAEAYRQRYPDGRRRQSLERLLVEQGLSSPTRGH